MKDALYDTLLRYDFDLCRGDKTITSFLKKHFEGFKTDLNKALDMDNESLDTKTISTLKDNIDCLDYNCNEIVNIIEAARKGKTIDAHERAYRLFDKLSSNLGISEDYRKELDGYYRIRKGNYKNGNKKAELFHIPYNKQHLIRTERYSIAGQPCLYVSSDIKLAW